MSVFSQMAGWFNDPPPELVFDLGADEVAVSRTRPPHALREIPLEPGVITPAQGKEGVTQPAVLAAAIQGLIPESLKRRTAALSEPSPERRIGGCIAHSAPSCAILKATSKRLRMYAVSKSDVCGVLKVAGMYARL